MFTKAEKLISIRNLNPKKKEGFLKVISIFSFLGIMLGVAILIIVMSVMNGFRTDLTNKILGLNPHIVIEPNGQIIDDKFKDKIKKEYDEFTLSESYRGEGIIVTRDKIKGILIKGLGDKDLQNLVKNNSFSKNNYKKLTKGSAMIGAELAYTLELKVGDKINLISSAFVSTPMGDVPKEETFIVGSIFNSGFYEFDQNLIFINLKDALSIFDKNKNDINLEVYLTEPLKANFYKKKIEKINQNFFVYSWADVNKSFFSALKVERNVMFIILSLIVVVAAFNIISGLTILVKNKTKEIAILRTLGISKGSITKIFFIIGFTIGLLATITGVTFGVLFSYYIENIRMLITSIFNVQLFPEEIYFLSQLPAEINFTYILIISFFSLLITFVATIFPSLSAAKLDPIEALKYE